MSNSIYYPKKMTTWQQCLLTAGSFIIVAFGQPAWSFICSFFAGIFAFALFWRVLLDYSDPKKRFILGTAWFLSVQMVQLSWFISHPYWYIYTIYLLLSFMIGAQFGILSLFITPQHISRFSHLFAIASFWTLCEWGRLFLLSGYSWNPVGLSLTANIYSLQMASLSGIFGLSFWVIIVNLFALRSWLNNFSIKASFLFIVALAFPFIFGWTQIKFHEEGLANHPDPGFHAILVQTSFSTDDTTHFSSKNEMIAEAIYEWELILKSIRKQEGQSSDLIVLPEYAVLCGTYTHVFPLEVVRSMFERTLGSLSIASFPPLELPWVSNFFIKNQDYYLVNNAFIAQTIANYFNSGVVIGLEDADDTESGVREYYSAALYFRPGNQSQDLEVQRYIKRILVPVGEYIPFDFFKEIAATYGINGSFTPGKEAKLFQSHKLPFGVSICYEETFGDIMRDNKNLGAQLLVNLTSDAWYPGSRLADQHFYHSRLRTVENGIPLIRASNLGVTGVVDSFGRIVSIFGGSYSNPEEIVDSIRLKIPAYNYNTLYSLLGDRLIVGISFIVIILLWIEAFAIRKVIS